MVKIGDKNYKRIDVIEMITPLNRFGDFVKNRKTNMIQKLPCSYLHNPNKLHFENYEYIDFYIVVSEIYAEGELVVDIRKKEILKGLKGRGIYHDNHRKLLATTDDTVKKLELSALGKAWLDVPYPRPSDEFITSHILRNNTFAPNGDLLLEYDLEHKSPIINKDNTVNIIMPW